MSNEILLIHLGGLGDVCLSESTFHSLHSHFGRKLHALGYTRFLGLFEDYFEQVLSIEEREWLWLFSDLACHRRWGQTVLIGKDKTGVMRKRLSAVSLEPPLFIDLYPEDERTHVEAYQGAQLEKLGVRPLRREPVERNKRRVIIYPEKSYAKTKWPYEHFIQLHERLGHHGIEVTLLEAPDQKPSCADSLQFDDLKETATFFREGALFVSNDSGIAHLAAVCGLATITLFWEHDPAIWHPGGRNISIQCTTHTPTVEEMLSLILQAQGQT